jgi:hypothetical protein
MLIALPPDIGRELRDNLIGIYLRGSLAMGDFDPATSDIDLLAVTERPVSEGEFQRLSEFHEHLARSPNPFANEIEIAYIERTAVRRYEPGQRHPTLGRGETLVWTEHRDNWVLERWMVRERGVALIGPDPRTLIEPVTPEAMCAAVRTRLCDWADWAAAPDDADEIERTGAQAYTVETMCRALYTLATGTLESKPRATAWALDTLPEPWRTTVERAHGNRMSDGCNPAAVPEVVEFVRWVASDGAGEDGRKGIAYRRTKR